MTSPFRKNKIIEDPQVKILKRENNALLEELDYWRNKTSTQEVSELNQLKHYQNENEILRQRFIQLDLKQKATMSSDLVIRDQRSRNDELELENKNLNHEISKYIDRLKECEILLAKIRQNEDNIHLIHLSLKEENDGLKQKLNQQNVEHGIQMKASQNFTQQQIAKIESNCQNQIQKLSFELQNAGEQIQQLTQINDQLKQDIIALNNKLFQEHDLRKRFEITSEMLQKKIPLLEENQRNDNIVIGSLKDQKNTNIMSIQEKQELIKRINILELQNQENHNQRIQFINQNQALIQQLHLEKKQNSSLVQQIYELKVALQNRDAQLHIQLEEIRQEHFKQIGTTQFYQEQIKNELLQKIEENELSMKTIEKLQQIKQRYEVNINQLISELESSRIKYIELERHRQIELITKYEQYMGIFDRFKAALYEKMGSNESKLQNLKTLFEQKELECDILRDQKEDLQYKFNHQIHSQQINQNRLLQDLEMSHFQLLESRMSGPSQIQQIEGENRILKSQLAEQEFQNTGKASSKFQI